jgi:predicted MFS family arabinose efflux permease
VLDETPRRPGRFDLVGALTATLGAGSVVWALIGAPEQGWGSTRTVGGLVLGALLLGMLAVTEKQVAHPLIQPALLRNRARVSSLLVIALVLGAQMSVLFLVVQYLENQLGFGPFTTGLAFLPLTLAIFGMSRISPRLLAVMGRTPMLIIGTAGLTVSFLWLSQLSASDSYLSGAFGPFLLNGISAGFVFLPAASAVLSGVAPEHAGSASGLLQTMQQLGGAIGLAVIVSVYAAGAVPGEFLPGAEPAFETSGLFVLGALAVTLLAAVRLRRPKVVDLTAAEPVAVEADDLAA